MKMKKIIAIFAATSMLMSSGISVRATTIVNGTTVECPIQAYYFTSSEAKNGDPIPAGTYSSRTNPNITYKVELDGGTVSYTNARVAGSPNAHAFRIYASNNDHSGNKALAARLSIKIGDKTEDNTYIVGFDAYRRDTTNYADYASLNEDGWDGASRLTNTSKWAVTALSNTSGYDWKHYEAEFSTAYAPELEFATNGWGHLYIDNIIVKDSSNNVIFSEDFEDPTAPVATATPTVAPTATPTAPPASEITDGEDVLSTHLDGWVRGGNASVETIEVRNHPELGWSLRVLGNDNGVGTYSIPLPAKASDGIYYITYTALDAGGRNTRNAVSIDLVGNNPYGASNNITSLNGDNVHVISGSGNYLYIAYDGWGAAWLDDIVVKNGSGKILFSEDFENFEDKYTCYSYETKLHGLSANGVDDVIYLSWRNPDRSDIASIQVFEDGVETDSSIIADIYTEAGYVNIVEMSDNLTFDGAVHEYDVRMTTNQGELFHNYISGKEGSRFLNSNRTKDGIPLQGWVTGTADGVIPALGSVEYDTLNKAEGNASLHINPNITYSSGDQLLDIDKTNVMASYDDGARMYLDSPVYGLEEGKTYKLSWKQKGHHVPHYYLYLVGDSTDLIGNMTAQTGFVTMPWQEREIEFTVDSLPADYAPRLRFEFSNGSNDFWLDDVKLVETGTSKNLLANGSFEYGMSNITVNDKTVSWTLADSSDAVNVYLRSGDTLVPWATLPAGTTSYTVSEFDGTSATFVLKTVKKSDTVEFLSEEYPVVLTQTGVINRAKFEVVVPDGDEYITVGVPERLTGDIYLKAAVKVESTSEDDDIAADMYAALYKDGRLLNAKKQEVSAVPGGTAIFSSIFKIPESIDDGVYAVKVFVWETNGLRPVKDVVTLGE